MIGVSFRVQYLAQNNPWALRELQNKKMGKQVTQAIAFD
jgi:hypothetical protein